MNELSKDLQAAADTGMTWEAYMDLFGKMVAEGRTSGPKQSVELIDHTKLNLSRSRRWMKTLKVLPELNDGLPVAAPQNWLVLTEVWCGDAAQCNPMIAALAERTPGITLRFVFRDEHVPIMDRYLTNGGRSIPKLIAWDTATGQELFTWGPRPAEAQALYTAHNALPREKRDAAAVKERLHRWYFDNGGVGVQEELLALAASVRVVR